VEALHAARQPQIGVQLMQAGAVEKTVENTFEARSWNNLGFQQITIHSLALADL
jgi:hypothetical protein